MTAVEELALVDAAITAIYQGAQEYRIGSRTVRRAELGALLARKKELEGEIAADAYGTTAHVAGEGYLTDD